MGDGRDELGVGLPGALFIAHAFDHRAAHGVHVLRERGDLVLALRGDGLLEVAGADLGRLARERDDAPRQPPGVDELNDDIGDGAEKDRQGVV